MTHREVLEALSGLLLGVFVTVLSSTVVSTSLPRIIGDLGGGESAYTWVVTSTLLSMTVSTPIWGKFADLFSRKILVQVALSIFVVGSILAGLSQNVEMLIGFRVIQGLGAGGMMALVQVVMADMISARDRGRYMGIFGSVLAAAQVGGPLLGGLVTDALGWHYLFYVGVPLAVIALVVIQRTLHLPRARREVSIDYLGASLIAAGVATLLIWISLAGKQFAWSSGTTVLLVAIAIVALALAIVVEFRAKEPIIPPHLFRNRTLVFAVIASIAVGTAMIGTSVFLSQYMQLGRGETPTETGLLTIPMVLGVVISANLIGRIVSKTGTMKRWLILGTILLTTGLALLGTIDYRTNYALVGTYLLLLGLGVGMCMQNLVLAVQNTTALEDMGSASAAVAFFRTLGGAVGISLLGALLSSRTSQQIADGMARLGIHSPATGGEEGSIPDVSALPGPVRQVVEQAYGAGVAELFLVLSPAAAIAFFAVLAIREVPLGTKSGIEQTLERQAAEEDSAPARSSVDA